MAKIQFAIPVLHVRNVAREVEFYASLGFALGFAHGIGPGLTDPCYCGLTRDGVWLHLSSHSGDRKAPAAVLLVVDDVDALKRELAANGVDLDPHHPVDQTWGTREIFFRDPEGYSVCLQQREFESEQR
jgi:catechol 2,3-dioxygenase-like lactoylglutathione lyase family enzyme